MCFEFFAFELWESIIFLLIQTMQMQFATRLLSQSSFTCAGDLNTKFLIYGRFFSEKGGNDALTKPSIEINCGML